MSQHLQHVWTVLKRNMLCYIHTLQRLSQRMFLFQRFWSGHCYGRETADIDREKVWEKIKGHRRLIVTPTSASSIYITTVAQEQFLVYM